MTALGRRLAQIEARVTQPECWRWVLVDAEEDEDTAIAAYEREHGAAGPHDNWFIIRVI